MTTDKDLRYPIGQENEQPVYESKYDEQLKTQLLDDIRMLPSNLEYAIQNLDSHQLETPYRPEGWTVKQLIHHVADSHMNAYMRFKLGLTEDNPTIKPYDQEAWANLPDTQNLPVNISLTLLHALHARWFELMSDIHESQWQRTVYHPERKATITLWELLRTYSWHSRHHTAHITMLRERMKWN
ncbi:MAG: putative metal-dependent hydrolase [Bacteroidota bacterium]|nr:putative metal-dependent hydrolase [Bacteroidota bacterium]